MAGVYTITNTIDGKMYVGCATIVEDRWRRHKGQLRRQKHHSIYLQRAWDKYGEEAFEFEVLVECDIDYMFSEENYWCNLLGVHDHNYGYNVAPTSPTGSCGHSVETRKKIGDANRGRKATPEAVRNIVNGLIGRKLSTETRQKISRGNKGKIKAVDPEKQRLANISRSEKLLGRVMTEEHKRKIGDGNRRRTPEQLAEIGKKISRAMIMRKKTIME